ncbi:hypothetical protein J4050_06440 [Winogradskyella sp. DF17]|uniref:Chemotaxis protein n=1 Tax=Winogradskyella pelagia TaxID=2819984 RepID=A0ABS3T0V4_9FLAO|nr:hypothetical protein [Winogradskyella sp. DF17]MBO3116376.1 hypothetical protein [Winogradskyella sp. DF17]
MLYRSKRLFSSFKHTVRLIAFVLLVSCISSCSLVKIESEQKPLGTRELNTRLLTQNYAQTAMDRVELAADSITKLAVDDKDIQINTLYWKIQTSEELGKLSFQTEPKIALMDTWSYFLEVKQSFQNPKLEPVFGTYKPIAIDAVNQNIDGIERIAASVLPTKEFQKIKTFVEDYAKNTPLLLQQEFKHKSIREDYLKFKDIPDSTAVQTVGTLSEVVADATNRFGYYSDASSKRLNWKAEMLLKKKGIDSMDFEAKMAEIDRQFERLITVAENSPETIKDAIIEFRYNISPLFEGLNYEIGSAMESLSEDLTSVDSMLLRERVALDSIIKRERIALTEKADTLVDEGIKTAFDSIGDTLSSLILYFILLFIVVLGLPFYLGYLIGKQKSKSQSK